VNLPSEVFLADVLTEPESLGALLDAYEGPGSPLAALGDVHERRVLFVGMGSSRYAALAACSRLRRRGIDAAVEYASAAAQTPPATDQLVVAISARGTTPETVEAAGRHRGEGRLVAVTNAPASPLGEAADIVLPLLAEEEAGGIACRTYQATVAVLLLLSGEPAEALRPAVAAVDQLVATREEWCGRALDVLGGGPLDVVAPAERQSSAEQAALMFREAPRIRATACETGDWLHVDVYLTRPPGYRAILFPGSRFDGAFVDWIQQRSCAFVAVGEPVAGAAAHIPYPGSGDPFVALLAETTATELLAAELWRRSLA
jgi:glucosamine--fructose-6-phosphate aminotransferase (isomerizing)